MLSNVGVQSSGFQYQKLIAKSPVIMEKLKIVEQVAQSDSSVLILGESGVGKEVFAALIHLKSRRREKPFVSVNCAGTENDFELAGGGTIFLDEITTLPMELQAKTFMLLKEKKDELRVLASSNRDIEKLVEKGEFHRDLFYRLNVFPLYIPPLRQRGEDLPLLIDHFFKKYMKENKNPINGFSDEAMKSLLSYSWPGNIRELESCIERACVVCNGGQIEAEDLFIKTFSYNAPIPDLIGEDGSRNLKNAENAFRARFIRQVLEENNWNQTETAKALSIQRTYLSRLIKELDINNTKE
jgi:Nif-specific regulatory protein